MGFLTAPILTLAAALGADAADATIEVDHALVTLIEQAEVPAREAGVLTAVKAREGQLVGSGDELALMDDTQPRLAKKRATIELDIARLEAENDVNVRFAQKSTEVARAELRRASESIEKYNRSVSATELDRLRLEAERAVLQVEQSEQEHKTAHLTEQLKQNEVDFATWSIDRLRIKAPIAGVVVEVKQHPGEWVEPGETVFRILRIDRLRVEAFVDVNQIVGVLDGRAATLRVDLPGRPATEFAGKIVFVSPEVDPVNGQVRVWAEVENRGLSLRPGLHGTLQIEAPADAPRPATSDKAP